MVKIVHGGDQRPAVQKRDIVMGNMKKVGAYLAQFHRKRRPFGKPANPFPRNHGLARVTGQKLWIAHQSHLPQLVMSETGKQTAYVGADP